MYKRGMGGRIFSRPPWYARLLGNKIIGFDPASKDGDYTAKVQGIEWRGVIYIDDVVIEKTTRSTDTLPEEN